MKGYKHTEETKKKLSESRKGNKNPMYGMKGKLNPFFGKRHTKETKNKISIKNWKGGSRDSYMKLARETMEGYLGRKLNNEERVHHLDHNPSNNNIDNLHLFKNQGEHAKYHAFLMSLIKKELNMFKYGGKWQQKQ